MFVSAKVLFLGRLEFERAEAVYSVSSAGLASFFTIWVGRDRLFVYVIPHNLIGSHFSGDLDGPSFGERSD